MIDISLTLIGVLVGFLVGLTGVGGAALLTPFLIMMGIQPTIAVGTDLVYNSITKIFGTLQHWRQKTVDWTIVFYLGIGSVPSAILAVHSLHWIQTSFGSADEVVKKVLGFALILIPIVMLIKTIRSHKEVKLNKWQLKTMQEKSMLVITSGAILGFIVGFTSVGSGSLFALVLLYLFQMRGASTVGTDIAHAFFLVTAAGFTHILYGNINYATVFQLLTGSIPGVFIGSLLALKVPTIHLRYMICVIILISGLKMI
ncbi:UPF0721 transmembrane protein [Brevibacillus halotolerans]|uniref:sulfite exporter TauE/SafE family protein n=1 Tax=Brevibacillus halotolerans TaxID=1507437 RepID=UPI001B04E4B9|nr:sulfite exporter TauE/SafE family protein [Brevibacillus halotolerans]GIO01964.1 UPF0721 transmembrane protein [Brevibacillus halotolerans]